MKQKKQGKKRNNSIIFIDFGNTQSIKVRLLVQNVGQQRKELALEWIFKIDNERKNGNFGCFAGKRRIYPKQMRKLCRYTDTPHASRRGAEGRLPYGLSPEEIEEFLKHNSLGIADVKKLSDMEEAFSAMLAGNAIFFMDGYTKAMKIASKGYPFFMDGYTKAMKIASKGYPNMGVSKAEA